MEQELANGGHTSPKSAHHAMGREAVGFDHLLDDGEERACAQQQDFEDETEEAGKED